MNHMETLSAAVDDVLLKMLPRGLRDAIDATLEKGGRRQAILAHVVKAAGKSGSYVELSVRAYLDAKAEGRPIPEPVDAARGNHAQ